MDPKGRRHRLARIDQRRHGGIPRPARRRQDQIRAAAHELDQRRTACPPQRFTPMTDPATLREGFKPTGTRYAIAARITGPVASAYPQGPPADEKPASGPPLAHLAKSTVPANIVIVADTDMLMDYMWVQTREFLGQRIVAGLRQQRRFRRQRHSTTSRGSERADQHPRPRHLLAAVRAGRGAQASSGRPAAQPRRWSCSRSCSKPRAN